MAVIYITLRTTVVAVIIFIVVVIAVRLLALRHRYAAACKLHRAPLHCGYNLHLLYAFVMCRVFDVSYDILS